MWCLRPRAPGVSERHHDLHATDEVHVQQHDEHGAGQQETQGGLAHVRLALLASQCGIKCQVIPVNKFQSNFSVTTNFVSQMFLKCDARGVLKY